LQADLFGNGMLMIIKKEYWLHLKKTSFRNTKKMVQINLNLWIQITQNQLSSLM
jgi:hypothetical protein